MTGCSVTQFSPARDVLIAISTSLAFRAGDVIAASAHWPFQPPAIQAYLLTAIKPAQPGRAATYWWRSNFQNVLENDLILNGFGRFRLAPGRLRRVHQLNFDRPTPKMAIAAAYSLGTRELGQLAGNVRRATDTEAVTASRYCSSR
jgi:hypothetical protein